MVLSERKLAIVGRVTMIVCSRAWDVIVRIIGFSSKNNNLLLSDKLKCQSPTTYGCMGVRTLSVRTPAPTEYILRSTKRFWE
jgi:hypothetical protein